MIKLDIDSLTPHLIDNIIKNGYCQLPCKNVSVSGKPTKIYFIPLIAFQGNTLNFYPYFKINNEYIFGEYVIDNKGLDFKMSIMDLQKLKLITFDGKEENIKSLERYKHRAIGKACKKLYL